MTGPGYDTAMRTCPKCGYVDPATRKHDRKYDAERSGTRAKYMREYRRRKAAEAARKAKKERTR